MYFVFNLFLSRLYRIYPTSIVDAKIDDYSKQKGVSRDNLKFRLS